MSVAPLALTAGKRPVCARCLRPASACICAWIIAVPHAVEVLILQHPLEVNNPKGSARLLHLCVPGSQLVVGETFAESQLQMLLAGKNNLLLYPDTPEPMAGIAAPPLFDPEWTAQPDRLQLERLQLERLRLVVLDGTWRKSRKMLYQNRLLQAMPRLALRATPPSHYLIRKAHAPDQLSTLEATCYALMQLSNEESRLQPLIAAFDGFVAQQLHALRRA
jgi:DTW domain-containing protein YfiP